MQIVTDPNGVLVGGTRYPHGTPLNEIEGATDAHIRIWKRFRQIGEATEQEANKNKRGKSNE